MISNKLTSHDLVRNLGSVFGQTHF